jgi:uncharacterized protein YukE
MAITTDDAQQVLQDAFYMTVGLGVLTFQQLQSRSRQLVEAFNAQLSSAEDRVRLLEERYSAALDDVQSRLPDPAGEWFGKAREAADGARDQMHELMSRRAA